MIKKKTPVKKIKEMPVKKAAATLKKAIKSPLKNLKKAPLKKAPVKEAVKKTIKSTPQMSLKKTSTSKELTPNMTPKHKTVKKTKDLSENRGVLRQTFIKQPAKKKNQHLSPFLVKQKARLLQLKDTLLDSMQGVARDNLHAGSQTSAFGMHQADAGSDAYDRDFALSILSQEQNSLYEIDEALKRIDDGTYGICEISNKQILRARLEARPFTRYTVECQADLEKRQHVVGTRLPVSALFGLTEEESENEDDENLLEPTKD